MSIQSLSGLHDYQPGCALLANELIWCDTFPADRLKVLAQKVVDRIDNALAERKCPRCLDPLPTLPEHPAGSRTTPCRCIPICGRCGGDESIEAVRFGGMSRLDQWPLRKAAITRRERIIAKEGATSIAVISDGHLITADGVQEIRGRAHPGGWAEYGQEAEK